MGDLITIETSLKSIDVTQLVDYSRKIQEIGAINAMMAPTYLRDFILAYDITNTMLSRAVRCDVEAQTYLDKVKAIAYLERAGDYLAQHNIKESSEARKRYVDIDPEVLDASGLKAKAEAIVAFLKNKMQAFRMAHDDVKKMIYGDSHQSAYEGM